MELDWGEKDGKTFKDTMNEDDVAGSLPRKRLLKSEDIAEAGDPFVGAMLVDEKSSLR